jgi:phosphoserine phosphatase
LILDFDGTCTSKSTKPLPVVVGEGSSSLAIRAENARLLRHYAAKDERGQTGLQREGGWMLDLAECFRQHGLLKTEAQAALTDIKLRPQFGDCLEAMASRGVPVAIVSGSARNFIWWVLEQNRLDHLVDEVYAFCLLFREGRVVDSVPETLVTPSNKGRWSQSFAARHGVSEDNIFGVGDSLVDRTIGGSQEHRLGVAESEAQAELIRPAMGHVVRVDQGFGPVTDWLTGQLDQLSE